MVPIRFHSVLLRLMMLVLLCLPAHSGASILQEAADSGDGRVLNRNSEVLVDQEFLLKNEATSTGSRKLKGWRMVEEADDQAMKGMIKSDSKEGAATSEEISGKHGVVEKPFNTLKVAMDDKGSVGSSSASKPEEIDGHFEENESERLRKATLDTVNMLSMDYNHKPRRKPPINNGQPLSKAHVFKP